MFLMVFVYLLLTKYVLGHNREKKTQIFLYILLTYDCHIRDVLGSEGLVVGYIWCNLLKLRVWIT
jgi:hypothetical protein